LQQSNTCLEPKNLFNVKQHKFWAQRTTVHPLMREVVLDVIQMVGNLE
jgi:hypothetical protein